MKRNIFTKIIVAAALFLSTQASAQTTITIGHYLKSINSTGKVNVQSVAYDHSGNLYAVGPYTGTITFNNGDHYSADIDDTGGDAFYAKFDRQGNVVWAKVGGGTTGPDGATAVAVDGNNNVYVAVATNDGATFNGTVPDNGGYSFSDIALIKLDSAGTYQWVKGGGQLTPTSLYIDKDNTVFVAGLGGNAKTFGGTAFTDAEGQQFTGFIMAFDSTGATHQHRQIYLDNEVTDITGDSLGNIYIVGNSDHDVQIDSEVVVPNPGSQASGYITSYIAKLNGSSLAVTWAKEIYSEYTLELHSVTIDAAGNLYTCGHYEDSIILSSTHVLPASGSNYNNLVAKYDNNGNVLWAHSYGADETTGDVYRVAYDKSTGKLWSTFRTEFGPLPDALEGDTIYQTLAIVKLNPADGNFITTVQSTTDGAGLGEALAVRNGWVGTGGSYNAGYPGTSGLFTIFNTGISYTTGGSANDQGFVNEIMDTDIFIGIETVQLDGASVTLYPNPSHSVFTVQLSDNSLVGSTLSITNLVGQVMNEQQLTNTTQSINLNGMAQGMYLVNIKTAKGNITKKLIVE